MSSTVAVENRPVYLTREGSVFRLSFRFDPKVLEQVKALPHASFDSTSKTWTCAVCKQSVQRLRSFHYQGLTDVSVDSLLADGEDPEPCAPAELRSGAGKKPYHVHLAMRGDGTYEKVAAIHGASWDKKSQSVSFPASAALPLSELVERGVLSDPTHVLTPKGTAVTFDTRTGSFVVRGPDPRASAAFSKFYNDRDVVTEWRTKGLEVNFTDSFSEEMYRGEMARRGDGFQPEGFGIELFPFQKRNVAVALERSGFMIADSPGLGKTVQAIAVGMEHLKHDRVSRVVVIVPADLRTQWLKEITRFTGISEDDVVVIRSTTPAKRAAAYDAGLDAKWVVVHYDVLARDLKLLKPLFAGSFVVADEAHRLKNHTSQRTVAALALARTAARRLALTGTPSERNVEEWYQVLGGFAVPGVFGPFVEFANRYRYKNKFGWEGARNVPELRERSRAYYGRHTKDQVAQHLPPLRVKQIVLDPSPAYAAALRRAHREAAEEIKAAAIERYGPRDDDEDGIETGAEMTAVGQLRLMCSSPRLVAESESDAAAAMREAGIVPNEDGPKLDELRVMLAEMQSMHDNRVADSDGTPATPAQVQAERLVVFTFSKKMANLISLRLKEDGVNHVLYTGDTSNADRDGAVAEFTDPTSDVVAFIATDAAAEGLNLGRCCSTLVQFDLPWTASRGVQRANRIHRIDGTAPRYLVINMVVANTMEIGVSKLLGERADLSDALFGESGGRYAATGHTARGKSIFEEAMDGFTTPGPNEAPVKRTNRAKTTVAVADPNRVSPRADRASADEDESLADVLPFAVPTQRKPTARAGTAARTPRRSTGEDRTPWRQPSPEELTLEQEPVRNLSRPPAVPARATTMSRPAPSAHRAAPTAPAAAPAWVREPPPDYDDEPPPPEEW